MKDEMQICPYCATVMCKGYIYAPQAYALYWIAVGNTIKGVLTQKKIIQKGGIFLDDVSPIGFVSKGKPKSYYCKHCNVLVTILTQKQS